MSSKILRLEKRIGSKARILYPYKIEKTDFEDIGLYKRFPYHKTFLDPFAGGWSPVLNHPCFEQEKWNTRTIPVIGVNDINKGIIDLAWFLLFFPFDFKMTVKSMIHCQGLWKECRDQEVFERFINALRFYYKLESSYGGSGTGLWIRQNMNRQFHDPIKEREITEVENGLKEWYLRNHSFNSKQQSFQYDINGNRGCLQHGKPYDYYDEIHSRLRWMQIFNEDFHKFLTRFIGKTDCGFIYADPPYYKAIKKKHYEDNLTLEQHKQLVEALHEADRTNIKFLLSYDNDERVWEDYSSFDIEIIQVPYSVAGSKSKPGSNVEEELLIRNYNYNQDSYYKSIDLTKIKTLDQFPELKIEEVMT